MENFDKILRDRQNLISGCCCCCCGRMSKVRINCHVDEAIYLQLLDFKTRNRCKTISVAVNDILKQHFKRQNKQTLVNWGREKAKQTNQISVGDQQ